MYVHRAQIAGVARIHWCPKLFATFGAIAPPSPSWHRRYRSRRSAARRRLRIGKASFKDLLVLGWHHATPPAQRRRILQRIASRMGKKGREWSEAQWSSSDSWSYWVSRNQKEKADWDANASRYQTQDKGSSFRPINRSRWRIHRVRLL